MRTRDAGFTLVELLIVIVILGLLTAIVIFAVSEIRSKAQDNVCDGDRRILATAVESYFALYSISDFTELGLSGSDPQMYEQLLVDVDLLTSLSEYWDIEADGSLQPVTPPCTLDE